MGPLVETEQALTQIEKMQQTAVAMLKRITELNQELAKAQTTIRALRQNSKHTNRHIMAMFYYVHGMYKGKKVWGMSEGFSEKQDEVEFVPYLSVARDVKKIMEDDGVADVKIQRVTRYRKEKIAK